MKTYPVNKKVNGITDPSKKPKRKRVNKVVAKDNKCRRDTSLEDVDKKYLQVYLAVYLYHNTYTFEEAT